MGQTKNPLPPLGPLKPSEQVFNLDSYGLSNDPAAQNQQVRDKLAVVAEEAREARISTEVAASAAAQRWMATGEAVEGIPDINEPGVKLVTVKTASGGSILYNDPDEGEQWQGRMAAEVTEGRKDDTGKVRLELIPAELLMAVGTILTFGANKYDDRNWELGMSWGRVFGALMRHMWCWWAGKGRTTKNFMFGDKDDETGHSHLWHAACCLSFLIAYEERDIGEDDRAR